MSPDHLAFLAAHHWRSARKCHHHHASHAHQDHPDHQVHLASPVHPDQTATPVPPERTAVLAQLDLQAPTDHLVNLERMGRKALLDNQQSEFLQLPATPDLLVKMDHLVLQARTVLPDPMEDPDQQALKGRLDPQVHPATMGLQATRGLPDPMVPKENRVFVQNTVLPTVVSSSRMEQDDKQQQQQHPHEHQPSHIYNCALFILMIINASLLDDH